MTIHQHDNQATLNALSNVKCALYEIPERSDSINEIPTQSITTNGDIRIGFHVPDDYVSLVGAKAYFVVSAGAAQTARDIDLFSSYGAVGELPNNHTESDTTSTYDLSAFSGEIFALDLSAVLTSLGGDDSGGIRIKNNTIGGALDYIMMEFEYSIS
jgi:hypothetical protein